MAIKVALNHKTTYQYDRLVGLAPQIVRLRPAPHCRTPIRSYSLKVTPEDHFLNWQQDPQGNYLARLIFAEKVRKLEIEVDLVAEMTVINPFDFFLESDAERFPFTYEASLAKELEPFRVCEAVGPKLEAWLGTVDRTPRRTVDFLVELNCLLESEIDYLIRMEPGVQSCEQTLTSKSGSCRDSAWLMVQILRNLGLAARFVSGYLIQLVPDLQPLEGPAGPTQDFTDLHAWAEVYLPGAGWVGLDPTSGLFAGEGHIPLVATPEPASAAPISGNVEECKTDFDFAMTLRRVEETARVTKPYTEEQWHAIQALGDAVDRRLSTGDVRLTMGGEPTFVSIDDMEGDEWNNAAMGPTKLEHATDLVYRLLGRFAPGGLLHYGYGKWYPGESLPRWALRAYWRRDEQPIWQEPELLADPRKSYGHDYEQAEHFLQVLAGRLKVDPNCARAGYEDVLYYAWKERCLPDNVDLLDPKLEDAEERRRLVRVFERGLTSPVGLALPLRYEPDSADGWRSGSWPVRAEEMFLLPGDSPMGLRLPLQSLTWLRSPDQVLPVDPFAPRGPLPHYSQQRRESRQPALVLAQRRGSSDYSSWDAPESFDDLDGPSPSAEPGTIRTALCVEAREGRLHVFFPPLEALEHYLDLVAAVEATAAELGTPVIVEGYLPPFDPRINHVQVAPDPGVIEVNVHPAHSWSELVAITGGVYEDARHARLGTEKFDLDGDHAGTGGGNHVVLGGPTPADSPFLRRPDLLRSLVGYWHNHPSLSYLFSGKFIGPTSQAPRLDEGRCDALYELKIAFEQIPEHGPIPPYLVDRIFRHLLVDGTGNTHRAEFCIDKLFSPDSATGRLGLVEFRAFEMPPHARMSLTQQLLVRALVARFWESPYRDQLVDWGTTLHDRFMLPYFVRQDFEDLIEEMRQADLPLDVGWFDPHFDFRFPRMGEFTQRSVHVELRQAIEPWYVLGEEPAGGAQARYVDSSVERLQVRVQGMTDPRYVLACNGRRVPLHPTGTEAEYVAGVRYRAWQPPSCLHPTIPVHEPLVFDLIDTWLKRSLGGCRYHVGHPGGLNPETFPVNGSEAESRRIARFFKMGHTGGDLTIPPVETNPEFPLTLDLRRHASG